MASIDRALGHLDVEIAWVRALLRLRLRELQASGVLPGASERFPGTAISPQEVEARLREHGHARSTPPSPEEREAASQLELAGKKREEYAETHGSAGLPLLELTARLQLDPDEYFLLLLVLAAEFDPSFPRLYGYLQNHFERQYATLALVAEALTRGSAVRVHRLLRSDGPLVKYGVLKVHAKGSYTTLMYAPITVDPRIVRLAQGETGLDRSLDGFCRILPPRPVESMVLDEALGTRLHALTEQFSRLADRLWDLPVVVLRGPEGSGKRHWACVLTHALGADVVTVDLTALMTSVDDALVVLRSAFREALLRGALLCVVGGKALEPEPAALETSRGRSRLSGLRLLEQTLRAYEGAVVLTTTGEARPKLAVERHVEHVDWGHVTEAHAARLWARFLPARARGEGASPEELARRFDLTAGQMTAVLELAQAEHRSKRITGDQLQRHVRAQVESRLGEAAHLVETRCSWDDLIVGETVQVKLKELVSRYRHSHVVSQEWGLGRRFGASMGLSVLFAGPSGTGKTMAAGIVAADLGLDVYQVDLSRVVSKWLGETEKALARIFDEAERARAILLFDEADSLFAKRTSVQSSNDRYANLEVNYLLQRIERFAGVAILTTNFPDSLDQAFKRRLSAQITFPAPDATERERLWRTMLAEPGLPKDEGIKYDVLAKRFELTGGLIRNAVLRAVFLAVPTGKPVNAALLMQAATAEMADQGMVVRQNFPPTR